MRAPNFHAAQISCVTSVKSVSAANLSLFGDSEVLELDGTQSKCYNVAVQYVMLLQINLHILLILLGQRTSDGMAWPPVARARASVCPTLATPLQSLAQARPTMSCICLVSWNGFQLSTLCKGSLKYCEYSCTN